MALHEQSKTTIQSLLDYFQVIFLVILLALSPWFYGLTNAFHQNLVVCIIFSIFILLCITKLFFTTPVHRDTGFDLWIYGGLGLGFLAVLISDMPFHSFVIFLRLLSLGLIYVMARNVITNDLVLHQILYAMTIVGVGYAAYGLIQYYGYLSNDYWYQPEALASRYVNSGQFAGFLLFFNLFRNLFIDDS